MQFKKKNIVYGKFANNMKQTGFKFVNSNGEGVLKEAYCGGRRKLILLCLKDIALYMVAQ